jgi:hypothetical protein
MPGYWQLCYVEAKYEYQLEAEGFTILAESATELTTRDVRVRAPDDACVVFDCQDEHDILGAEVS